METFEQFFVKNFYNQKLESDQLHVQSKLFSKSVLIKNRKQNLQLKIFGKSNVWNIRKNLCLNFIEKLNWRTTRSKCLFCEFLADSAKRPISLIFLSFCVSFDRSDEMLACLKTCLLIPIVRLSSA